jgi:hypothetical protein
LGNFGSISRVQSAQAASLLNEDGTVASPFQTTPLTPEIPFLVAGETGKLIYIRLLGGQHARRLAVIRQQELVRASDLPQPLVA